MLVRTTVAALAAVITLSAPIQAQAAPTQSDKALVNVDKEGLALQGYDPVAFFTMSHAMAGKAEITAVFRGATYRFASAENKALFEQDPAKYEPAFGGFCAYGVSQGGTYPVDISTFQILHGQLVLNKTPKVKELFDADREANYQKAITKWPGIVEKKGK